VELRGAPKSRAPVFFVFDGSGERDYKDMGAKRVGRAKRAPWSLLDPPSKGGRMGNRGKPVGRVGATQPSLFEKSFSGRNIPAECKGRDAPSR